MVPALVLFAVGAFFAALPPEKPRQPLLSTVELKIGESREVELADGTKAKVELLAVNEV
jgi:ferric-dicitrate binding protein FerR (iron transport regulator)